MKHIQSLKQSTKFVLLIALTAALPSKYLKAQKYPEVVLNIQASPEFLRTIDQHAKIVAERELITSLNPALNQEYPIRFKGNIAQLSIPSHSAYVYLRINLGLIQWPFSLMMIPGDTLQLNIKDALHYSLSATHQSLSDLQFELEKTIILNRKGSLKGDDPNTTAYLSSRRDTILQNISSLVSAYHEKIPIEQLNIISTNAKAELGVAYTSTLAGLAIYGTGVSTAVRATAKIKAKELYTQITPLTDTLVIRHSIWYASYLFKLEQLWAGLQSDPSQLKHQRFGKTFTAIMQNYSDLLREKLLIVFFRGSGAESDQFQVLLQQSLTAIKDPLYHQLLLQMQAGKSGSPAYPFRLESESGKFYSLNDFKGKILICKFWFRGCSGCITLHQNMKPIIEKFKNSPDVVFVSINVDLEKKSWQLGLKEVKYTSSDYLNLYVGTQGRFDPMIVYYNYTGFPQLLIIDKYGKIINAAAERPGNDLRREKLEDLIRQNEQMMTAE